MSTTYSYPQYSKTVSKHCKKCLKIIRDGLCITQEICHENYCPRCVCQIFQPYYLNQQPDIIIELYCGHYVDRSLVENIFREHCVNCGARYDAKADVEMKDKIKLCRICFDLQANRYKDFLFQCMSCNRIIRSLTFLADAQIILCRDCATAQSSLQSKVFKEEQEIPYNPKKSIPQSRMAPKMKKKESQSEQDISIVSKFSALQISDSDKNIEGEENKNKKIKMTSKHSIQIRVQNLKIKVQEDKQQRQRCETCGCLVIQEKLMLKDPKDVKSRRECQICFMTNFDPRESSFYQSFARSSVDKNKHTSAPKHKGLEKPTQAVRTMKKSYVFGATESVATQPNPSIFDPFKFSTSQAAKSSLQPWQNPKIDLERLCQICKQNRYMIIRSDKKKVCTGCHAKK